MVAYALLPMFPSDFTERSVPQPRKTIYRLERTVRLTRPTLAIAERDGKNVAVTVPEGAYIKVGDLVRTTRLIEVTWDGQIVQMFAADIRERGELVAAAS
jgi:hypothetical protein